MKTITELARDAGIRDVICDGTRGCLKRLAEIVRADERKACADAVRFADNGTEAAEIIRARGNT